MQSSVVCYYAWSLLGSSCTSYCYLPVFPFLLVWCWWEWPHYSSRDWVTHEGSGRGCARVQDPWHDPGSGSWWKWNCRVQWVFGGRLLGEAVFQYCTMYEYWCKLICICQSFMYIEDWSLAEQFLPSGTCVHPYTYTCVSRLPKLCHVLPFME